MCIAAGAGVERDGEAERSGTGRGGMARASTAMVLATCLVGSACGESEPRQAVDPPVVSSREDSSGVAIWTLPLDAPLSAGWSVGDTVMTVPSEGPAGRYQLFRIVGLARLRDGTWVVANRGDGRLLFFDAAGGFVRGVGGAGEGPGQFRAMVSLEVRGDTLFAHDYLAARVSRFDGEGDFVSTTALSPEGGRFTFDLWPTPGGLVGNTLGTSGAPTPSEPTFERRVAQYVRWNDDGSWGDTIATRPGRESYIAGRPMDGGGVVMTSAAPIVGHRSEQTWTTAGLAVASTDRWIIDVFGVDGAHRSSFRSPGRERPVTDAEWDRRVTARMGRAETEQQRRAVLDMADDRRDTILPAFGRFLADPEGYLWMAPGDVPDDGPIRWLVLSLVDGSLREVAVPRGFAPRRIERDVVAGVLRDDLDQESVVVFRLNR